MVCSSSSAAAQMAVSIPRKHSWAVSGTPVSNRVRDLQGLLQFLGWEPFCDNAVWRAVVQALYEARTGKLYTSSVTV